MGVENPSPFIDPEALRVIRQNTDWQRLFVALGIQRDEKRSRPDDWWGLSPLTNEKNPSFHMNHEGVWFDFSSGIGGGPIELVQAVMKVRGKTLDCFKAGAWLLENGLSSLAAPVVQPGIPASPVPAAPAQDQRGEGKKTSTEIEDRPNRPDTTIDPEKESVSKTVRQNTPKKSNAPVRQNLLPLLSLQGEHPLFLERGISKEICLYLGCGFLEKSRGPLKGRIVFQVRSVVEKFDGSLERVVLSHIGRAITQEQELRDGKWHFFSGFNKSCELFNVDNVLLDEKALDQAKTCGHLVLVEGAFDVAKLVEAGIKNVIAAFGSHVSVDQGARLTWLAKKAGISKILVFLDRDEAGRQGTVKALELLKGMGLDIENFDWNRSFSSPRRTSIRFPESVQDPCDFSVEQLRWLRDRRLI